MSGYQHLLNKRLPSPPPPPIAFLGTGFFLSTMDPYRCGVVIMWGGDWAAAVR